MDDIHAENMEKLEYLKKYEKGDVPLKPPLGCKPSWLASQERIETLGEAIVRYAYHPNVNGTTTKQIKAWAKEILYHCEIMENC